MDEAARAIVGNKPQEAGTELLQRRTLIEVRDAVRKRSKHFTLRVPRVDVVPGEITAVVGPNGAGKTTLLHMLAGLLALDDGTLRHRFRAADDPTGRLLGALGPSGNLVQYRREVSFVPQSPPPFLGKLAHALELTASEFGFRDEAVERTEWWLKRLGLTKFAQHRHRGLSDGYRMRAAIALQLIRQPQVLLLDEPIGPLDVQTQEVVLSDLRAIASSERWPLPIVVSSQHLDEIEAIADRIIFLDGGTVKFSGSAGELRAAVSGSLFELRSSLNLEAVQTALGPDVTVEQRTAMPGVMIRSDAPIGSSEVLQAVLDAGGVVHAFKDLGGSSRRLFEDGAA